MNVSLVLLIGLMSVNCVSSESACSNLRTSLGSVRKRRHLTFPDNTNVVLTISLVKAFMTHAPSGWNIALEIDVLYPLPHEKEINRFFRRKLHHKQKREFWEKLENALEFHNVNGRACIIRSICEAKAHLAPKGTSLVHDILRVLFTASVHDEEFKEEMKEYREFSDHSYCKQQNDCPFSLIDFILALNQQY